MVTPILKATSSMRDFSYTLWFLLISSIVLIVLLPLQTIQHHLSGQHTYTVECDSTATLPLSSNGLTDVVQWDGHSLVILGQRILLWSGEIHPWRIPSPSLWLDILEKAKAAGMNAVSVYSHWGMHNPSSGNLVFDGYLDWQHFLDTAKAVGLFVVFRPGPYINAETTGGGIPGWVIAETQGHLRSNGTSYTAAWRPYINAISEIIKKNQITEGGPIIAVQVENEYSQKENQGPPHKSAMMELLKKAFVDNGIVVPLTHNDAGMNNNFVNGTGAPDLYGFDEYPQGFNCSAPEAWNDLARSYHQYHLKTNPQQPLYIPELQAGAFDPWGPRSPGYHRCRTLTDSTFQSVYYQYLLASNARMINLYMLYGGTSWGNTPFPGVYTSYDYGSAISESRELTAKYGDLKSLGLFLRSVPQLYNTEIVEQSDAKDIEGTVYPEVTIARLHDRDSEGKFHFIRHTDITSNKQEAYRLVANTSVGTLSLPQSFVRLLLPGRTSSVIPTDLKFGRSELLYSTATILFAGVIDGRDVLFVHGPSGYNYELELKLTGTPNELRMNHPADYSIHQDMRPGGRTLVTILAGKGLVTIWDSDKQLIIFADTKMANTFYSPTVSFGDGPFKNYWQFGTNQTILIGGPYLVREALLTETMLELRGDISEATRLTIIAFQGLKGISWNGEPIVGVRSLSSSVMEAVLEPRVSAMDIHVPRLGSWKYHDSLPEISEEFSDYDWIEAVNTTTNSRYKPAFGDGRVLHACDYGFCEGTVIWRGYFNSDGSETGAKLLINGGEAFAASVWLNGHFLKTTYGNSSNNENIISETDEVYHFPSKALRKGSNVLTILQDNMGLDETGPHYDADASRSPRGIRGFDLLPSGRFSTWKVQGKRGGYRDFADKSRGIMNEGGLYGERQGWHLPGFDASDWKDRKLAHGLPGNSPGVGVFRTEFDLDMSEGFDVPISIVFDDGEELLPYRALIFVNGWMMGKRVGNLGPQFKFPIQEGILNYHGSNTLAVFLWVMEPLREVKPRLRLAIDGVYDGGVKVDFIKAATYPELYGEDGVQNNAFGQTILN